MGASIAGLMLMMHQRGFAGSWVVFGGMVAVTVASVVALSALLRAIPASDR